MIRFFATDASGGRAIERCISDYESKLKNRIIFTFIERVARGLHALKTHKIRTNSNIFKSINFVTKTA